MNSLIRAFAICALILSISACVAPRPHRPRAPRPPAPSAPRLPSPPAPAPTPAPAHPTPREVAAQRLRQVDERIDDLNRRIDKRVDQGAYSPQDAAPLHHRLEVIRREAHDIADQHGGGLSNDEQAMLNGELDSAAHAISL